MRRRNSGLLRSGSARGRYAPEGAYPVIGRSINYRFGSFHALSDAALLHLLPKNVSPAQVRCALTAVMKRQLGMPETDPFWASPYREWTAKKAWNG